MKGIVYFIVLCMCCACRYGNTAVEEALILAGKNRGELEAVLEYYREDSLKTKAAEFLIGNMPGHYSFADTVSVNRYYDAVDAVLDSLSGRPMEEVKGVLERLPFRMDDIDYGKVEDVEIVTADYLIRHIDTAFVRWKHGAWARHLDFDEFCEYLLPYKMEEFQYLDGWRDYLWEDYRGELDGLKYSDLYWNSALQASLIANNSLKRRLHPHFIESAIVPVYRLRTRMRLPCGVCDDYSNITVSVMRSLGIPVACDFTPHWPVRASGHTWNVVKGNNGNNLTFGGADTNPDQPHNFDEKKAKIFRHTYAANPELKRLHEEAEYVPETFQLPFMKDVTREYMDCKDVEVVCHVGTGYAYLAVFDKETWAPVDFARMEDGKAVFQDVGLNIVYLPVIFNSKGEQEAIGHPFLLEYDGHKKEFIADTLTTEKLVLRRKYPAFPYVLPYAGRLVGAEIQASDSPDFEVADTLFRITDGSALGHEIWIADTVRAYRYWRYIQPWHGTHCNIAEVAFYERGSHEEIRGTIIGTDGSWGNNPERTKEKVFDGDLLTYFDAPIHSGGWVGMDFGKPVSLEKVLCTPRGDGNTIEVGDRYELFYWSKGHWVSLGEQVATTVSLVYEDVPVGTLYWLRNRTKGKDERLVSYEEGRQVWW